ncbi:hypothetical protein ABS767_00375 [Sphingomonas sp. ST-64]|uniref:Protein TonB n=1 Tax=Sphingomonas plantiphila TaxID=3163295 RepID=A0ABW8YJL0_9SPHN
MARHCSPALSSAEHPEPNHDPRPLKQRLRARFGDRALAVALAIAVELALGLVLLSIAPKLLAPPEETVPMAVFGVTPDPVPDPDPEDTESAPPAPTERADPVPPRPEPEAAPPAAPLPPAPQPPAMLDIPLGGMPDIATLPRASGAPAPARRAYGPAAPPADPRDSRRVEGRGPNGEPLYAASWFREPYDSELRGYLSTARPPGWALIACRTVAEFRVDNCALLDEYPDGAQIGRAVLAAAWQFRVRPPRLRGQYQVGEWVRIKIIYELRTVSVE